jgi:hypothetical protein
MTQMRPNLDGICKSKLDSLEISGLVGNIWTRWKYLDRSCFSGLQWVSNRPTNRGLQEWDFSFAGGFQIAHAGLALEVGLFIGQVSMPVASGFEDRI